MDAAWSCAVEEAVEASLGLADLQKFKTGLLESATPACTNMVFAGGTGLGTGLGKPCTETAVYVELYTAESHLLKLTAELL
jgi:hypothetical protein